MKGHGTAVATSGLVRLVAVGPLLLMGCLVTDDFEFDENENTFPPSIESRPNAIHPLDQPILVDLTDPTGDDVLLEVNVRDPDVFQTLQRRVFIGVDCISDDLPDIAPQGSSNDNLAIVRPVDQRVFRTELLPRGGQPSNRCIRLELRVSGDFMSGTPFPVDPNDVGTAVWWIYTKEETGVFTIDPNLCTRASLDELCR